MTLIPVEVRISSDQILAAVEKLPEGEFEDFVGQVLRLLRLQAQRSVTDAASLESGLVRAIQQAIPPSIQSRFSELVAKRHDLILDDEEQRELCALSDQIEALDAQRIRNLSQLAQLRSTSIDELMQQLILIPVDHGLT